MMLGYKSNHNVVYSSKYHVVWCARCISEDHTSLAKFCFGPWRALRPASHAQRTLLRQFQHGPVAAQEQHSSLFRQESIAVIGRRSRRNSAGVKVHAIGFHHHAEHRRPCWSGVPRKKSGQFEAIPPGGTLYSRSSNSVWASLNG